MIKYTSTEIPKDKTAEDKTAEDKSIEDLVEVQKQLMLKNASKEDTNAG